ncbi:MAG TPA: thiolase domain-containing protein [Patescibacteria group bacterium]|jgi:acetyl-CoA C-acetyltransferase
MTITIAGNYITRFGELWDQGLTDLLIEASLGAVKNANLESSQIEAVFVANMAGGNFNDQRHLNAAVSQVFFHHPPAMRIEGACASGGLALLAAEHALLAGQYQTVLVVGAEKMLDVTTSVATKILATAADTTEEYGSTFPGLYAMLARAHMSEHGTTRDQLSSVAVKNHLHGLTNPYAQYKTKISVEQVNQSPLVSDPLRLLDCSPLTDGAAAVVLTIKRVVKKPIIIGFGHGQDSLTLAGRKKLTTLSATVNAAKQAYQRSTITPTQVQVAEVHDCFTIAEILAIEDLGFFKLGAGGKASQTGKTTHGGKIVINPSGGLKASGHPIGATGIKQVAYLAQQIEKSAFNVCLAHNVGGSGATAVVHVLKGSKS